MKRITIPAVLLSMLVASLSANAGLLSAEGNAIESPPPIPFADKPYEGPTFDEIPPIEAIWDKTIAPVTGVDLATRNATLDVLGDGVTKPYPKGVSDVVLNRSGVLIYGEPEAVEALRPSIEAKGLRVGGVVPTDGTPFVDTPAAVAQAFQIPWYAGQQIFDQNATHACTSGFAFRVQWGTVPWRAGVRAPFRPSAMGTGMSPTGLA